MPSPTTDDIDRCIDTLHVIRLAQSLYGNGPQGHAMIHEALKMLLFNPHPMSLSKKIGDALVAVYGAPPP